MRFVIFGSTELVGASLLRFLIKTRDKNEIVACSVTGELPKGLFLRKNVFQADIRRKEDLRRIIQEGDVIFNGQVDVRLFNYNERIKKLNLHRNGLINLLEVANEKKAAKVITYLPAFLTWSRGKKPYSENKPQHVNDFNLYTYVGGLEVCRNYWKKEYYGYLSEKFLHSDDEVAETFSSPPSDPGSGGSGSGGPGSGGPGSGGPGSKKTKDSSNSPSLLEAKNEVSKTDSQSVEKEIVAKDEKLPEETGEDSLIDETYFQTKLTLIRGGILFGPFEEEITPLLWKGVKLQSLTIYGGCRRPISWLNPYDLAIALLQANNFDIEGEYFIKSFDISTTDLIQAMDTFNLSKTHIKRKLLFPRKLYYSIKSFFSRNPFFNEGAAKYLILDSGLLLDEKKARRAMKWRSQHNIEDTVEESFGWFNDFYLSK